MAETIKSVLFLDYDSIRRALEESDRTAADRLGMRVPAWIAAIESGALFGDDESPARRRILMRRCYADPTLLGSERSTFLANGFQVVDCPPAEGRDRNAAVIHMVLDTIDALDHPAGYEEFVLLSADTDLSPILIRLRAHNRSTAIYANPVTADSYMAIADAMIDEEDLLAVLLSDERPKDAEAAVPAAPPPAERSEIESLARKVSAATSVPLFAPRTYADLFRQLVEEIAEKGYHHQATAENVAARMTAAGRNVTRRQVVFVVKGLALKGHVFSTGDTPERLAEVFREQVLYLGENAQLNLDDKEKQVLASWIVGRVQPAPAGTPVETEIQPAAARSEPAPAPAPAAEAPKPAPQKPPAPVVDDRSNRASRRRQQAMAPARPEPAVIAAPPPKPVEEPPKPAPAPPLRQAEPPAPPPAPPKPPEEPKPMVRTVLSPKTGATTRPVTTTKPPLRPARPPTPPQKPLVTPPPAASTMRPSSPPPVRPAPIQIRPALTQAPARPAPAAALSAAAEAEKDAVESSILAAIAQAVDVLVEDSGARAKPASTGAAAVAAPAQAAAQAPVAEEPPPAPDQPQEEELPEGDDIGDEIQRIIASYNRNREQ